MSEANTICRAYLCRCEQLGTPTKTSEQGWPYCPDCGHSVNIHKPNRYRSRR